MTHPTLTSILLASTDPERLRTWYVAALDPDGNYVQIIQLSEEARAQMAPK